MHAFGDSSRVPSLLGRRRGAARLRRNTEPRTRPRIGTRRVARGWARVPRCCLRVSFGTGDDLRGAARYEDAWPAGPPPARQGAFVW